MRNDRDIVGYSISNDGSGYDKSVREKYRYLNASRRNSKKYGKNFISKKRIYSEANSKDKVAEEKLLRDFSRLVISMAIVAVFLGVRTVDTTFTNSIEDKAINLLRSSSEIDNKISNVFVSIGSKMGITINELNKDFNISEGAVGFENEENETLDKNNESGSNYIEENEILGNEVELGEIPGSESVDSNVISEEQVSDFYIDEELLEEVFNNEKKWIRQVIPF